MQRESNSEKAITKFEKEEKRSDKARKDSTPKKRKRKQEASGLKNHSNPSLRICLGRIGGRVYVWDEFNHNFNLPNLKQYRCKAINNTQIQT